MNVPQHPSDDQDRPFDAVPPEDCVIVNDDDTVTPDPPGPTLEQLL